MQTSTSFKLFFEKSLDLEYENGFSFALLGRV
jgi:hypothetical protein